jgi:hypothetical protein
MITTREPRLRLRGRGARLRLHAASSPDGEPLDLVRECCRASLAIEKALGEAITSAHLSGRGWGEIAEALGASGDATTRHDVIEARAEQQRSVWRRFWPDGDR